MQALAVMVMLVQALAVMGDVSASSSCDGLR